MGIKQVDFNPFSQQYGDAVGPVARNAAAQPPMPRQQQMPTDLDTGLQDPLTQDQINQEAAVARNRALPGRFNERAKRLEAQQIINDMRQRYANNPGALAMINFLAASHDYGNTQNQALRGMARSPAVTGQVPQANPLQQFQTPQQAQPSAPQSQGGPYQQRMRAKPGMVVNGYRLMNPAKPNDPQSWQPIGK